MLRKEWCKGLFDVSNFSAKTAEKQPSSVAAKSDNYSEKLRSG